MTVLKLKTVRDRVQTGIKQGLSLEQLTTSHTSQPLADLDGQWGKGFLSSAQFIELVYSDLSRSR